MKLMYVVEARTGQIKVGLSMRPKDRVESFRIGSPVQIRLIAVLGPGNRRDELKLQRTFDDEHVHGEWFHGPKATAFAASVFGLGVDSVSDWVDSKGLTDTLRLRSQRGRQTTTRRRADWAVRGAQWAAALREARQRHPDFVWEEIYPVAKRISDRMRGVAA